LLEVTQCNQSIVQCSDFIPASDLVGAAMTEDRRAWVMGRRKLVLEIARRSARPIRVLGDKATLQRFATQLHELGTR
jgi:hypothetical protein